MGILLSLLILFSLHCSPAGSAESREVSFFGSSHVNVRLQEAKSSSDIYFRLRTRRSDSMLFLAAGRTDYCLLVLDAGRLKVHINLGAGETEIGSEAPFLLNDMKWHRVNLTRRGSQLTIQVDDHFTKANLPTRFHELNIHFGVWLGGLAGFNEIFLGNLPSFRGCMSHITYNSEDVLLRAKTQPGAINGVSWNCSEEFDVPTSSPFSIQSASSYVITRIAIPRQGTLIKINVLPVHGQVDGLIFYVSGMSSRPDYLALQLRDGKAHFVAEMGSGPVQIQSTINIIDNMWHAIKLQISPSILSLTVDNESWTSEPPARGGSRHLDVSELVYLGGVEDSRRTKVRSLGLIDQSFRGCIKEFVIENKQYGLPEVDVSRNVTAGCGFPGICNKGNCRDTNGTNSASTGSQIKSSSSSTKTSGSSNSNNINATRYSRENSTSNSLERITTTTATASGTLEVVRIVAGTGTGELEIMRVSPIQVAEGDSVAITPRHLAISLDLSKYGIRESGVLFKVSKPPSQGRLEVATRTAGSSLTQSQTETFSLLDVGAGRVRYYHNGAENSQDSIELFLRLGQSVGFLLPPYLQDERVFLLSFDITPVNDPPEIRVVPGGFLRLAERTKIRLTPDVITSLDPDTLPKDLIFTVIPMEHDLPSQGYIELNSAPGKSIESFTQENLESNQIWYVDQGASSSRSKIAFKVTDGSSVSSTAILRVETFPLRIVPEVNTGIEVANLLGTTVFITSSNLSFTSNAGDQGLILQYHILKRPNFGTMQLKRTNGQWSDTEKFTEADLKNRGIRYLLQRPSDIPIEDDFTFHVSLAEVKVPTEFRFKFRIVKLRIEQIGSNILLVNGTTQTVLTTTNLEYRTFPTHSSDSNIKYSIVQAPRYGFLSLRLDSKLSLTSSSPKISTMSFTQADLSSGRIFYQFRLTPYSPMTDSFLFNVTTSQLTDGPFLCQIYHSTHRRPGKITASKLMVTEGMKEFITTRILSIKIRNDEDKIPIHFNVTVPPSHGILSFSSPSTTTSSSLSNPLGITQFTSNDLEKRTLFYQHDGSESPTDKFQFIAWNDEADFLYEGQLDISLLGINNHSPRKSPSASLYLYVVQGGSRKLSKEVLEYIDDDWDTEPSDLKYTSIMLRSSGVYGGGTTTGTGIGSIGNVYDKTISMSRPIFSWTQADIDKGKLIFKHEGGSQTDGILHYWVSDSKFTVNGTLKISAGSPWVKIVNTTTLASKRGSIERLPEGSMLIDTNVDTDEEVISIRLESGPTYGMIKINGISTNNFTLGDISNGNVYYENYPTSSENVKRDSFRFQALVPNGLAESDISEFEIDIFPEAYWTPLTVGANSSIMVNENSSAVITQAHLLILNTFIPPTDIVYTLTKPPKFGYLAIDPSNLSEETDDYVTMWDQTVINEGRLRYVQSEPNKTFDSMSFDVTNGVRTLADLRLDFVVIPTSLQLASNPLIVNEGASVTLNLTHLHSAQNFFADKLSEVQILEGPKHGVLEMISRPKGLLKNFPYKALNEGKILYTHDGSETLSDHFTVIAQTFEIVESKGGENKEKKSGGSSSINNHNIRISSPHLIQIQIIPGNDEVPRVLNNTGTWVWAGSTTVITNSELAAVDEDSDKSPLVFYVVGTKGGFLALMDHPEISVTNFTQEMINESKIIFNHKGEDMQTASFDFEVSDGLNEASKETFKISIRKPELVEYEGRVKLPVFPLTQAPLKPENLLVRSSDGREISFKTTGGPGIGQLLIERSENKFSPVSMFTQTDVNNGKIFYQHLKPFRSQRANDSIRFTAASTYAEPLHNITVEIDISVTGASLGGLQRYVSIEPLSLREGSQVPITDRNVNLTAVIEFINIHQKGNIWRGMNGEPILDLRISEVPRHGIILYGAEGRRFRPREPISLHLLSSGTLRYVHDDSETEKDSIGISLFLWKNDTESSTWLLNLTLPVHIIPVNDQPFQISPRKGPIVPVVQNHWRKLNRNDLFTMDPDTLPTSIIYEVNKISHGRLALMDDLTKKHFDWRELPTIFRFTQADVDSGKVIFYHSGPVAPVFISLRVSDGQFPDANIDLTLPVQSLTLSALQSQASPIRIQQGNSVMTLSLNNLPVLTNGQVDHLSYNVTRFPLHGKIQLKDRVILGTTTMMTRPTAGTTGKSQQFQHNLIFRHSDLVDGELAYVQTDLSVANDSFEVTAHYAFVPTISTKWLVNVVSIPLLKRVKEVRSFVKGFAVGGLIAPEESEFTVSLGSRTTLNLAVLDASPLAAVTGANPAYEILLPPKYGVLLKLSSPFNRNEGSGRIVSRFSHEDVRRGFIIYSPPAPVDLNSNEIIPLRLSLSSSSSDEFIFKVLAPTVQPALGIAKFKIRNEGHYYIEKNNEIISDGSTDPATKRTSSGSGGGTLRDLTGLVTPNITKDSIITVGVIVAGAVTLTLFLVVGIRCTCVKKGAHNASSSMNSSRNGGLNNGRLSGMDPANKCNGIGIIDSSHYSGAPSTATCTLLDGNSDSDCGHPPCALRPLLISPLSPRSRHRVGTSHGTASDSGSWTSSGLRNEIPTPSVPQCRVTPLCSHLSGSDSYVSGGGNSMIMCPLLPPAPTPVCDTFTQIPCNEDIDPTEAYGFTYGPINSSISPGLDIQTVGQLEDESRFTEMSELNPTNNTNTLSPTSVNNNNGGTLRRNNGVTKNQYWV